MSDYISQGNFPYHNKPNSGVFIHAPGVKKNQETVRVYFGFYQKF